MSISPVNVSLIGAPALPAPALAHQLKTALRLRQTPLVVRQRGELVAMMLDGDDADALRRPERVVVLFGVPVGLRVQCCGALPAQQGPAREPLALASKAAAATARGAATADCDWSSEDDDWIPDAWRDIDCEEHARKANGGQPITLRS